jgi:hypothetical protein
MMTEPRLHIAIPTFNRSAHLAVLLESIRSETKEQQGVTVHVSDNASTDETARVCEEWSSRMPFLTVNRLHENQGGTANILNALRSGIHSDYTWLLIDYSVLERGCIAKMLQALREQSPSILCAIHEPCTSQYLKLPVHKPFKDMDTISLAEIFLWFSSVSSVVAKSSMAEQALESITRLRKLSYPHLGLWNGLSETSVISAIELPLHFQSNPPHRSYAWFQSGVLDYAGAIREVFEPLGKSDAVLRSTIRLRRFQNAIITYLFLTRAGFVAERLGAQAISNLRQAFPCPTFFVAILIVISKIPHIVARTLLSGVFLARKGTLGHPIQSLRKTHDFWLQCCETKSELHKFH